MPATQRLIGMVATLLLASLLLGACGGGELKSLQTAPVASQLHPLIQEMPLKARSAYQYALDHNEVLSRIPCYCGCGSIHSNVRECFVKAELPDGTVEWDFHGAACGICQDIVHDSMLMLQAGAPLIDIRAAIDQTYSRYAPPTDTPPVSASE